MKTYLALSVMESMFRGSTTADIERRVLNIRDAREMIADGVILCFHPKLECVLVRNLYGIDVVAANTAERAGSKNERLRLGEILLVLNVELLEQIFATGEHPVEDRGVFVAYTLSRSFPD